MGSSCPMDIGTGPAIRAAFVAILILLAGCSEPDSPEQRIRQLIADGESAVEDRSLSDLRTLISEDYLDGNKRTRQDLTRVLAGYFLRHKSIHLLVQIHEILVEEPDRARAVIYVAMAGRPLGDASQLSLVHANLYRFELQLSEVEGDWRVAGGAWRKAVSGDFLE